MKSKTKPDRSKLIRSGGTSGTTPKTGFKAPRGHSAVVVKQRSMRKLVIDKIMLETVLKYQNTPLSSDQNEFNTEQRKELSKFTNEQLLERYEEIMHDKGEEAGFYAAQYSHDEF
jgi:hypothetical protein